MGHGWAVGMVGFIYSAGHNKTIQVQEINPELGPGLRYQSFLPSFDDGLHNQI